jgi:NADPH:quinone reductase-like Zn-dependent oxidoreductase
MIGVLTGPAGPVPTAALMVRQANVQGVIVGSRKMQQDLVAWLDTTDIRPVIDKSFRLEQLADAARYEESGAHFGKIAVEW